MAVGVGLLSVIPLRLFWSPGSCLNHALSLPRKRCSPFTPMRLRSIIEFEPGVSNQDTKLLPPSVVTGGSEDF